MAEKAAIWLETGCKLPGYSTVELARIRSGHYYTPKAQNMGDIIRLRTTMTVLAEYVPSLVADYK
jgi:hypothetical protein